MERILVIDDSRLVRDMLKSLLVENNFAVDAASTANEGLHYITNNSYDLIIADYMLPDINGLKLLSILKEKNINIPIIILTSKGNEQIAVQSLKLGAVDYIVKSSDFITHIPVIIKKSIENYQKNKTSNQDYLQHNYSEINILIVDDNDVLANLTKKILELNNITSDIVKSGQECINKLFNKSKKYNLVLINYTLPDFDGITLLEKMRKTHIKTPAILLSSITSEILAVKAIKLGALDYIAKKPGYMEQLPKIIFDNLAKIHKKINIYPEKIVSISDKILIVGKNKEFKNKIISFLTHLKYEANWMGDDLEKLKNLKEYDAIVMESFENDYFLIKKIKEKNTDIPIIYVCDKKTENKLNQYFSYGISEYVWKENFFKESISHILNKNIQNYLNSKKLELLKTEISKKNELLDKKLKELQSVNEIANYIVESTDIEKALYNIIEKISSLTKAKKIFIMFLDNKKQFLSVKAAKGIEEDKAMDMIIKVGEAPEGYVAKTEKPLFITDINKDQIPEEIKNSLTYSSSFITIPLKAKNETIGVITINEKSNGDDKFTIEDFDILNNFANYITIVYENAKIHNIIQSQAFIDDLTDCYNKKFLNSYFKKEFERARRYNLPLSILMIDIDNFKEINDTFGHQTGDKVLIEFCKLISFIIRLPDILIRYGGEEFLIILPNTNIENAYKIAERIRKKVESISFLPEILKGKKITISIGIASLANENSETELLKNADSALYQAKRNGKNEIIVFFQNN